MANIRQYWWNLFVNGMLSSYVISTGLRRIALNLLGTKIQGAMFGHCTMFSNKLSIGEHSFVNRNCFIDNNEMVTIGNNCAIAYNVSFITTNHSVGCADRRGGGDKTPSN